MNTGAIQDILQEDAFAHFFENVHDLIQVVDLNGRILYTNNSWIKTFGYSTDEVKTPSSL